MAKIPPVVVPPSAEDVLEKAEKLHLDIDEETAEHFAEAMQESVKLYEKIDEIREPIPDRRFNDRDPGYKPPDDGNPNNVYVTKCRVSGTDEGILDGYEIGIKDNIRVRGVEMTGGSKMFEGFIPSSDATVVTRLLEAGGEVTAKLNMTELALLAWMSAFGPVRNPRDPEYLAGSSSSGSAAAVVMDEVDISLGTDGGGSVRLPAAWCGCVGHKPTNNLLPETGMVSTVSTVGPFSNTVDDCARALDAMTDPSDEVFQRMFDTDFSFRDSLSSSPDQINVGMLREGFDISHAEQGVNDAVASALDDFESEGATIEEVSVPQHQKAGDIHSAISIEELTAKIRSEGVGHFRKKSYDVQFADAFGKARRTDSHEFLTTLQYTIIFGQYMADRYLGKYHAKAQNLRPEMIQYYDDVLTEVDVLAMPTVPKTAISISEMKGKTLDDQLSSFYLNSVAVNTKPFNLTGHPAISIPCGVANGLPVGLMLVGERFDDKTVFEAADAFEQTVGWDVVKAL